MQNRDEQWYVRTKSWIKIGNLGFNLLCHFQLCLNPTFHNYGLVFILALTYFFCAIFSAPWICSLSPQWYSSFSLAKSVRYSFILRYLGICIFGLALHFDSWKMLAFGTIVDALSIILLQGPLEQLFFSFSQTKKNPRATPTLTVDSIFFSDLYVYSFLFIFIQIITVLIPLGSYSYLLLFLFLIKIIQHFYIKDLLLPSNSKNISDDRFIQGAFKIQFLYQYKDSILLYSFGNLLSRLSSIYFVYVFYMTPSIPWDKKLQIIFLFFLSILGFQNGFQKGLQKKFTSFPLLFTLLLLLNGSAIFLSHFYETLPLSFLLFYIAFQFMIGNSIMTFFEVSLLTRSNPSWISTWISLSNIFTFGTISTIAFLSYLLKKVSLLSGPFYWCIFLLSALCLRYQNKMRTIFSPMPPFPPFSLTHYLSTMIWTLCLFLGTILFIIFYSLFLSFFPPNHLWEMGINLALAFFFSFLTIKSIHYFFLQLLFFIPRQLDLIGLMAEEKQITRNELFIFDDLKALAEKIQHFLTCEKKYLHAQGAIETIQHLAHEIRRPFIQFQLFFDCLEGSKDSREKEQILQKFIPLIRPNFEMVQTLLEDLTQLHAQQFLCYDSVDLLSTIALSFQKIQGNSSLHPDFQIFSSPHPDEKSSFFCFLDSLKIQRVFENIFLNAFEAMAHPEFTHPPRLHVYLEKIENNDKILKIRIWNSHSSIQEKDLEKVFASHFTKNKQQGKGLGLAICAKIIKDHGGDIFCQSHHSSHLEECSVEFTIILPYNS